jgi:hypothetical protein
VSERGPRNLETFNLDVRQATDTELYDTLRNLEIRLDEATRELTRFSQDILKIRVELSRRQEEVKP